jgi:hypothetical protein
MRRFTVMGVILLALAVSGSVVMAQSQTGTITGRVADEQGAVLPGVTVTLTGRQGAQTTVTDERGVYRFVGLNPGVYNVQAELSGFAPQTERNIDVGLGREVRVNLNLTVGSLTETVEVVGRSASVDVTSTATDNTLSNEVLASMPINVGNFNTATSLMNFAPGINAQGGFGGDQAYGNACSSTASTRGIRKADRRGCSSTTTSLKSCRSAASARRRSTAVSQAPW